MADRIAVGIIRRAHGLRGEVSVEPWTDSGDRFRELDVVTLVAPDESAIRETHIESVRAHGERALVKLSGIDSPEDVENFRNWTIEIPAADARRPEPGTYFLHDLLGLAVIDQRGTDKGTVVDAYEGGGGILLNVRRPDGRTFELPFATELLAEIDLAGKKIVATIPEGLDDLDAVE